MRGTKKITMVKRSRGKNVKNVLNDEKHDIFHAWFQKAPIKMQGKRKRTEKRRGEFS